MCFILAQLWPLGGWGPSYGAKSRPRKLEGAAYSLLAEPSMSPERAAFEARLFIKEPMLYDGVYARPSESTGATSSGPDIAPSRQCAA